MWVRWALAVFLVLVFLGIILPSTGRVVIGHATTPPTPHIVGRIQGSLIAVAVAVVPLALICIGTFRRSPLEIPGWILLAVLVVIVIMK
jgi:hypothetical protein